VSPPPACLQTIATTAAPVALSSRAQRKIRLDLIRINVPIATLPRSENRPWP
jgi:hypothetical protein